MSIFWKIVANETGMHNVGENFKLIVPAKRKKNVSTYQRVRNVSFLENLCVY